MREILFRGKRTDNGEWVEGFLAPTYIVSRNGNVEIEFAIIDANKLGGVDVIYGTKCIAGTPASYRIIPETVGEYTGLTDINGKKIFEDDIFICYDYEPKVVVLNDFIYWVGECIYNLDSVEVIGNVHDNPELLNKENENDR